MAKKDMADYWWFAYPLSTAPQPSLKREIFVAECELTEIIEEVLDFLCPPGGTPSSRENPEQSSELYHRLTQWKFSLPPGIREEDAELPAAVLIHANLDMVLISLIRPFEDMSREEFGVVDPKIASSSHAHSAVSTVWRFRTLYTLRHEYFNTQVLSIAAFRVLFDLESSPIQLQTFIKAIQGLTELSERYPVARDVLASIQTVVTQQKSVGSRLCEGTPCRGDRRTAWKHYADVCCACGG